MNEGKQSLHHFITTQLESEITCIDVFVCVYAHVCVWSSPAVSVWVEAQEEGEARVQSRCC